METSEELFSTMGYKAVSMDQIAEAAGISKMTIYKHFKSKEELFISVILDLMNRHYEVIENKLFKITGTMEKINYLMFYSLEGAKEFSLDFYKDIMTIPQIMNTVLIEKNKKNKVLFKRIIVDGMEKREIRKLDPDFVAEALITMVELIGKKYFNSIETKDDLQDMTKNIFDILKYGLLGGMEVNKNGQQRSVNES